MKNVIYFTLLVLLLQGCFTHVEDHGAINLTSYTSDLAEEIAKPELSFKSNNGDTVVFQLNETMQFYSNHKICPENCYKAQFENKIYHYRSPDRPFKIFYWFRIGELHHGDIGDLITITVGDSNLDKLICSEGYNNESLCYMFSQNETPLQYVENWKYSSVLTLNGNDFEFIYTFTNPAIDSEIKELHFSVSDGIIGFRDADSKEWVKL